MILHKIRHEWPEKEGFAVDRPHGAGEYIFLHFFNPVDLLCNNEIARTKPHACIILSMDRHQWFKSPQKLVHDWFHFTQDVEAQMSFYGITLDTVYYPVESLEITNIVRKMESEFFTNTEFSKDLCELYIRQIFIMLARSQKQAVLGKNVTKRLVSILDEVRRQIFSYPMQDWPVSRMADLAGLCESRFYSVYKSVYKITPNKDLIFARIEKAKNFLQTEGSSVSETAEALGYKSVYHFIRQFKSVVGITPGNFKY